MEGYKEIRLKVDNFSSNQNSDENERSLKIFEPKVCYNFKSKKGSLVDGNGIEKLKVASWNNNPKEHIINSAPFNIEKLWHYSYYSERNKQREYLLVILASDKHLYFADLFSTSRDFIRVSELTFSSEVDAINFNVNGQDVIAFCSGNDDLVVWFCDDDPYIVSTAPRFTSICLHNDRLFAITNENQNAVRYSSKTNPLDWKKTITETGGGEIKLNDFIGKPKKLISFLDNVYVFRDYGISRIMAYSAKSSFSVTNFYSSSVKIYTQTVCICGKRIFFMASDGLYETDGYNVEKTPVKLGEDFSLCSQENANSTFFNGKLYISCNLQHKGKIENENNSIIEYDIDNKKYNISHGVNVIKMLSINDLFMNKMVVARKDNNYLWQLNSLGKIDENICEKYWESGIVHLDYLDKKKILKDIYIKTLAPFMLTIKTEKRTKEIKILASEKAQCIRCNVPGKEFKFIISTNENNQNISDMQLRFKM